MTHALLKGALPIYARMLAESCGVQVEFGHATPHTNGITIFLPDLPVDDPTSKALAFGMIMHEAGHVTETAFSAWPNNPVVADMANRLEDIRMEGCQIRKYPGGRQRLSMMVDGLVSTGYFGSPAGEMTPNEAMAAFVLYRLRANVLGQQAVAQYADIAEEQCRKLLPEPAVTRLDVLMNEVISCRNTADVVTLATEIVKMLEEEQKKAEEEQDPRPSPSKASLNRRIRQVRQTAAPGTNKAILRSRTRRISRSKTSQAIRISPVRQRETPQASKMTPRSTTTPCSNKAQGPGTGRQTRQRRRIT